MHRNDLDNANPEIKDQPEDTSNIPPTSLDKEQEKKTLSTEQAVLTPFFQVETSFIKRFNFGASLLFTQMQINNPFSDLNSWDLVAPHLYLGIIPTVSEAKKIKEAIPKLKLVVSVVEPFELKGKAWPVDLNIQSPQKWKDMDVDHYSLPVEDFTTIVAEENIYEAIKKIHECIIAGGDVYVHCKAGRGRSALLCACYLAVYGSGDGKLKPNSKPAEVYAYLQSKRKQVSLREDGLNKIQNLKNHHENFENKRPKVADLTETWTLQQKLNSYLASIETKKEIAQLTSFKELSQYAADKSSTSRATHIKTFLNDVRDAKNANWYFDLFNSEGPLKALLAARPLNGFMGTGLPKNRINLVASLKKEVEKLIMDDLKCTKKDLEELIVINEVENFRFDK